MTKVSDLENFYFFSYLTLRVYNLLTIDDERKGKIEVFKLFYVKKNYQKKTFFLFDYSTNFFSQTFLQSAMEADSQTQNQTKTPPSRTNSTQLSSLVFPRL